MAAAQSPLRMDTSKLINGWTRELKRVLINHTFPSQTILTSPGSRNIAALDDSPRPNSTRLRRKDSEHPSRHSEFQSSRCGPPAETPIWLQAALARSQWHRSPKVFIATGQLTIAHQPPRAKGVGMEQRGHRGVRLLVLVRPRGHLESPCDRPTCRPKSCKPRTQLPQPSKSEKRPMPSDGLPNRLET